MKDMQFRALLDLMMVCDPWPLEDNGSRNELLRLLTNEAKKRGYDDSLAAYHAFLGGIGIKPAKKAKVKVVIDSDGDLAVSTKVTVAKKRTPRKTKAKGNKDE